jgi:hypothetical protein
MQKVRHQSEAGENNVKRSSQLEARKFLRNSRKIFYPINLLLEAHDK